jgi:hypothetical protein
MKFCDLLDGVIKMMKKYERGLDLCIVSDGISPLLMKFLVCQCKYVIAQVAFNRITE